MANELLDFVMSLVRDPDAAARYAADPSTAIADAHLTNVTSADVNNLIPMVADSLSMAAPAVGGHDALSSAAGNVWTSGAATAAFDAFTPHIPDQVVSAVHDLPGGVIDTGSPITNIELPRESPLFDDAGQLSDDFADHAASAAQGLGSRSRPRGITTRPTSRTPITSPPTLAPTIRDSTSSADARSTRSGTAGNTKVLPAVFVCVRYQLKCSFSGGIVR